MQDGLRQHVRGVAAWFARTVSARFLWWAARAFIFPSLAFVFLYIFLTLRGAKFDLASDILSRPEMLLAAVNASLATVIDITNDALIWPTSRRGILSFVALLLLVLVCTGVYGGITAFADSIAPLARAPVISWIAGLSMGWALFVQLVISPQPFAASTPQRTD
jgi:hypothetical protein